MNRIIATSFIAALLVISIGTLSNAHAAEETPREVYLAIILNGPAGGATSSPTPEPTPVPTPTPVVPADLKAQVIAAVNAERQNVGCPIVVEDAALMAGAQAWVDYMVANNYLNHSATIDADWYLNHGYTRTDWVSENIAGGPRTGADAVALWMSDPPHKATVLTGCDGTNTIFDVGVGYNSYTWVLVIGELQTAVTAGEGAPRDELQLQLGE